MAELVDMKLPKRTEKELKSDCCATPSIQQDRWPYGLQLRLETEQVSKLPHVKEFKVGDKVSVLGEGTVTEVRMSETQSTSGNGETRYTVEIQIEKLGVTGIKVPSKMSAKEYRKWREKK